MLYELNRFSFIIEIIFKVFSRRIFYFFFVVIELLDSREVERVKNILEGEGEFFFFFLEGVSGRGEIRVGREIIYFF